MNDKEIIGYLVFALYILIRDVLPKLMKKANGNGHITVDSIWKKVDELDTEIKGLKVIILGYDGHAGMVNEISNISRSVDKLSSDMHKWVFGDRMGG